ncbi:hypothetical protein GHNINEIG_01908 [Hydrogenovibrio crunogenus]|uniref:Uncharacterized protein n=1 Tax=Hydrogenovibrio crunogenus TaxID=39765 RepID=A0A4P7P112_9GAMM|nr:hypothetical protein [Hydrogenovibrio crunogenus]QBZ83841.1 hypothetical protein GHNINEIG_01908 [Hydrogenovibrio crunogenus]
MSTDKKLTLKERIDADEGLKSKRLLLTTVSLVLIVVTFTGAVIEEANTFILKISFQQGEALSLLLALVVLFLTIRYYSYAFKYHQELTQLWKNDFFKTPSILDRDYHSDELSGLLIDVSPGSFESDLAHMSHPQCETEWDYYYESRWLVLRYFVFEEINKQVGEVVSVRRINLLMTYPKVYFQALLIEFRHRFGGYLRYPENLDIQAPYLMALAAICSLVFQSQLAQVLSQILNP